MIDWPVAATFMTGIAGASVTITAIIIRSVVIKNGNGDLMPILTKQNETMAKLTIILNDLKDNSKDIRDNTMHIKSCVDNNNDHISEIFTKLNKIANN